MAHFRYQALNAQQEPVAGEIDADSALDAITRLEAEGLAVQSIANASAGDRSAWGGFSSTRPARASADIDRDLIRPAVERSIARSKDITPALGAYAEELPRGRHRSELLGVVQQLLRGNVEEAIEALKVFPEYWIPLLSASAKSSDPGEIVRDFLARVPQSDHLRQQRWKTVAYPLVIVGLALAVFTALSFLVVPTMRAVFDDFGLRLPDLTLAVFVAASWVTNPIVLVGAVIVLVGGAALWAILPSPSAGRGSFIDRIKRPFGRSTSVARLAGFTADLLEAGLNPPSALPLAAEAAHSQRLRTAAVEFAIDGRADDAAEDSYAQPLTATVVHAMRSAIPTASRIRLLRAVSETYAERANARVSWTRGMAAPLAICAVGIVVGIVVLALYLPLVSLIQNLSSSPS